MIRKFYFLFLSLLLFSGITFAGDSTYYGNGRAGFGGPVGQGSLHISFGEDSIHFTLYKGAGSLNDAVVIYIAGPGSEAHGFTSTANFTDDGDGLRRAISGYHAGSGRSVLTFASGFTPEIAIAFNSDFAGVFELRENGAHEYLMSANLTPTGDKNASAYTFSIATDGDETVRIVRSMKRLQEQKDMLKFLVTYISETGYRSNEFIGDIGPSDNPGFGDYVSTSYFVGYAPLKLEYSITHSGNDNIGFGGAVGKSAFTVKVVNDSIFLILKKKMGELDDIVVIYAQGDVPGHPTGISSTANFTDYSDAFTRAISGFDGTNRSLLNFVDRFHPDVAFVFDKTKASMYKLMENGNHLDADGMTFRVKTYSNGEVDYIAGMKTGQDYQTIEEIEDQIDRLGLLVTYVRQDGFRSNEFVGDPGPHDNPGWSAYQSVSFIGDKGPIPVTLTDFKGVQNANSIDLIWKTSQESNIEEYQVERSGDGVAFEKIGNVKANNSESLQTYSFKDAHPLSGNNFYKLAIVSKDGHKEYSKTISVKANAVNTFKAYTVSSNRILKLEYQAEGNGNLIIELTNAVGQKVFQTQLKVNSSNVYSIDLNKKLPLGVYSVSITNGTEKASKMIMIK